MAGVEKKSFEAADEVRTPEKTRLELVQLPDVSAARIALQPGWRWADCIQPVAGTDSCQARHVGVVVSGGLHLKHDDGTEVELGPGDAYVIAPGHDAWVTTDGVRVRARDGADLRRAAVEHRRKGPFGTAAG